MQPLVVDPARTPGVIRSLELPLRVLWADPDGPGLTPDEISYRFDPRFIGPKPGTVKLLETSPRAFGLSGGGLLPGAMDRARPTLLRRLAWAREVGITLFDGAVTICTGASYVPEGRLVLDVAKASYLGRLIVHADEVGMERLKAMAGDGVPPAAALPVIGVATCLFSADEKLILTVRSMTVGINRGLRSVSAAGALDTRFFGGHGAMLHEMSRAEMSEELGEEVGASVELADLRVRSLFINDTDLQVAVGIEGTSDLLAAEILTLRGRDTYEIGSIEAVDASAAGLPKLVGNLVADRAAWEPMSLYCVLAALGARHGSALVEALIEESLAP